MGANTITSPLTLLPFVGALLAKHVDMAMIFYMVIVGGAISLICALRMTPPSEKVEA